MYLNTPNMPRKSKISFQQKLTNLIEGWEKADAEAGITRRAETLILSESNGVYYSKPPVKPAPSLDELPFWKLALFHSDSVQYQNALNNLKNQQSN